MYPDAVVEQIGQLSLQHDWHESLRSGCKSFWVAYSAEGQNTIYGEIKVSLLAEGSTEVECSVGFEAEFINKNVLRVQSINPRTTSYFFAPDNVFTNLHGKSVRCLDVSPGGGLAVSCGDDEGLYVWQTDNGNIRRSLEGHISDVSQCRFFPSGVVVLSGGTDMKLRIWSVEDGSCPVILTGHTGAITGTAIVDKGRNIISCSRDGSAMIWDCGSAQCLRKLENSSSVINTCCISQCQSQFSENTQVENHEKECGMAGKLLLLAREDGYLDGVDLHSKNKIFSVPCYSAVNDCCFVDENSIVVGLQDGKNVFFDIRNTRTPQRICKYGKSSINCVQKFPGDSILIGRGDGSCSCVRNITMQEMVSMELSGPNCDPLFGVTTRNNFVYTACRDSHVRKYKMDLNC